MYHLIIAVISIALMGFATSAQVQYINPQAILAAEWKNTLERDLKNLEDGFLSYKKLNTRYYEETTTNGSGENITQVLMDFNPPSDITDLSSFITPPAAPGNLTWSFGSGGQGFYYCLQGDFPSPVSRAARDLKANFGGSAALMSKYHVHDSCGAAASVTPSSSNMAITYWVMYP